MSNKIQTRKCHVGAVIQRNTFNEEERTVEVVWSTGAKGKRYSWTGAYYEELSMKKDHVRLERLNQGAPVLNNHRSYDLSSNLGVVEKAWIKGKEGHALLRLSSREEIAGTVKDIQDGIIRNISVGYAVHAFEEITKKGDEIPTYRAVDWEPMEIYFVNMPFDKDAQVRSMETETDKFETMIINTREAEMPDDVTETTETTEAPVETKTEVTTETSTESDAGLNKSVEQNSEVTETKEERSLATESKTETAAVEN